MTYPVKFFTSSMQGAPQLTNAWGDLVTMLDAVLVNGFNLKSIDSITRSGSVATATISAGHLYRVDQVLLLAGSDQTEYNGEVPVISTTATTFTFAVTGTPATPATGTLTAKVAPLGFAIAFTGTNKRAYRSANVASNRPYLRVDNSLDAAYTTSYAKKGKVTMAESMTDIDTFVGAHAPYDPLLPTKNEIGTGSGVTAMDGWYKWYYARTEGNTTDTAAIATLNRNWVVVGDDRGFYFFPEWNGSYGRASYCFTDFISYRSGDAFNTLLGATDFYAAANAGPSSPYPSACAGPDMGCQFNMQWIPYGKAVMRDHLQLGNPVRASFASLNTGALNSVSGYDTNIPWPNGPDYSLLLHPVYIHHESTGHMRGVMPGMMWVLNNQPLGDLAIVDNVSGYAGRKFLIVMTGYNTNTIVGAVSRLAFDITGPWY